MSGTFGVCDERGNYVQMLWFSSATLSIRAHQRKWVKNETFLKYFRKAFKPAFDMNDKLEDLANGIIPPVKEIELGPDGLPKDRIERWKFKARNFKEESKRKIIAKGTEVKDQAKAKAIATVAVAKVKANEQFTKVKSKVFKSKSKDAGASSGSGDDSSEKAKDTGAAGDDSSKVAILKI